MSRASFVPWLVVLILLAAQIEQRRVYYAESSAVLHSIEQSMVRVQAMNECRNRLILLGVGW